MTNQQDILTVIQAATVRQEGGVELVTRNEPIRPGRHTFASLAELTTYLGQVLGGRPEGEGIRGSMSRKGTYCRRAADGTEAVTFGDPVLDAISSADGTLVIGGATVNLRNDDGSVGRDVIAHAAPYLKFTGIVNGAERWASDDGAMVQYRLGTGALTFHAWKKHTVFWSMGGEISVTGTNAKFEAADILSLYYMSVDSPCAVDMVGHDSDRDDSYVDQYEWGINAPQPERVATLCRAQWHHARFTDVLTAGSGCLNYLNETWPAGFPQEWVTVKTAIELNGSWTDGSARRAIASRKFAALTFDMSDFGRPAAQGSIVDNSTISVTFPDDATYTGSLHPPNKIRWSNGSTWTKITNAALDLNGEWTDGGGRRAAVSENAKSLKIDMSDFDRPSAHGSIVDNSTIKVTFPDDATYTGKLQPPDKIQWSNGSAWKRV
jgi:hypothetical protein